MNSRILFLGPLATVVGLAACSGQGLDPTSGNQGAQSVSSDVLTEPVTSCETGYAHPNVCCGAAPGQSSACEAYPDAPFQPCASTEQTYPDPRTCCPLDASGEPCHAPPADAGTSSGGGTGSGSSCTYPCPPGFAQSGAACCPVVGMGVGTNTACVASPIAVACPLTPVCSCPAEAADAAPGGCTCESPPECTAPSPPQCGPCPSGWQVPEGEPGLCCEETSSGAIACFSQAISPPPPPVTIDAGGPPGCVCSEPSCPPGAPCPLPAPCECDGGSGEADAGSSGSGSGCETASDCNGPLPSLAERCSDGGYAAAHWTCVSGVCDIAFCN
jgi:hypothetical protein